jgi:cardiolipin synthase
MRSLLRMAPARAARRPRASPRRPAPAAAVLSSLSSAMFLPPFAPLPAVPARPRAPAPRQRARFCFCTSVNGRAARTGPASPAGGGASGDRKEGEDAAGSASAAFGGAPGGCKEEEEEEEEEAGAATSATWGDVPWWQPIVSEIGTVPNMITLSRIAATPFLGYIIIEGHYAWAFAGVSVFGWSDWLDGYIARKWDQRTVLGTFLDPFADKILIMTMTLAEGWAGLLPAGLVGLIVARDLALVAGGFYMRAKTKPDGVPFFDTTQASAMQVTPSLLSKFNTLFQVTLLTGALLNASWQPGAWGDDVVTGLSVLTFVTTFGSGVDYWINRPIANVHEGGGTGKKDDKEEKKKEG